ncbi:MAG: hypothetical protein MZV64_71180 [Ignavibacteriales bacterium]|nr:hypothetical protein [Ignavibacteriales bacterium]
MGGDIGEILQVRIRPFQLRHRLLQLFFGLHAFADFVTEGAVRRLQVFGVPREVAGHLIEAGGDEGHFVL